MPKFKEGTTENLHRLNRHLSLKYDRTLTISDTINFLALYYAKRENPEDIEINPGIWDVTEINGNNDDEKEPSLT